MGKPDAEARGEGPLGRVSVKATGRAQPQNPRGRRARAAVDHRPVTAPLKNRLPPGQDTLSPKADVRGRLGATTPRKPSLSIDHRPGRTPFPLRLVCPGRWELLPPAGPP